MMMMIIIFVIITIIIYHYMKWGPEYVYVNWLNLWE